MEEISKKRKDICETYDNLRNNIKDYLLEILAENNTTVDNPFEVNAALEFGAMGLSTLEMPHVDSLFIEEDRIWINTDWSKDPVNFDELCLEDQIDIIKNL